MRAAAGSSPGPLSALALLAIRGYQRWLSPLKGFRCAHSVLHGGSGCSGYAMTAISESGLIGALGAIRRRFRECRAAFEVLKSEQAGEDKNQDNGEGGKKAGMLGNACPASCAACDLGAISCCG